MKRFSILLLAVSLPALPADVLPTADAVVNHFVAATGGKPAWEARHSQIEHATISFPKLGIQGALTIYEAAPDKYLGITDLPGAGKISTGSDGTVAWESSALQGARIKEGDERADAMREGTFNAPLHWHQLYVKGETAGSETVEGHDCYKVVFTPKEGRPVAEFYDKKSGLMVKTAATVTTQMGDISAEIVYEDYRKDGALLSPRRLTNRAAQQEFVIQINSIEVNPDLPKDRFDLPPEIQALLPKPAVAERKPVLAAPSPDRNKLSVYLAGSSVDTETYTLRSSASGYDLDGSASATLGTMHIDVERFFVHMDPSWRPLEAIAKGKLGQIPMSIHSTFADGQATNEIENGQGKQSKTAVVDPSALVVNSNLPLFAWAVLAKRVRLDTHEPQQFPVYIVGQSQLNASVVFSGREKVDFAGKSLELDHLSASGSTPEGQPISLDLWIDQNRTLIKLAVPSQGAEAFQEGFDPVPPKGD